MPLTSNCDVFASISENTFNAIIANVARQRPSLFNYGTASFVASPGLMCRPIQTSPGLPASQPRVTLEPPIPVPGTSGAYGLEFCAQLTKLAIDFHPGQLVSLPAELKPPLGAQSLAIQAEVCAAIACPGAGTLTELGIREADRYPPIDPMKVIRDEKPGQELPPRPGQLLPVDRNQIHCFCLSLFAVASLRTDMTSSGPALGAQLRGLEIVDIEPKGLEQSLECLMTATIALGVLPRLRISLNAILLSLGQFGNLQIGLTPTSPAVPFNPSLANDELSVFVTVTL